VHSLGALTGMQAMQMVKGGLKAIYCSGWQVAADANAAAQVRNRSTVASSRLLCSAALYASAMLVLFGNVSCNVWCAPCLILCYLF